MRITANALLRITSFITGKGTSLVSALFFVVFVTGVAGTLLYARDAHAAVNSTINFQARILQAGGAVVPDGSLSVQFKIYNAATAGTNEWTETQSLTSKNGYITASLGAVTAFPGTIDWSQEHWITMNINGDGEMGPTRMKITAVPYSFRSGQADSLTNGAGTISASQLAQLAPGSVQGVSSSNTALRINQTGAGSLLQLQGNGSDVFTVSKAGDVAAAAGLTVGNSTSTTAGTIRWTGSAFEGYNGSSWTSLGGGLVLSSGSTASFTSGLQNVAGTATGTNVEMLVFTSSTAVSNVAGITGFTAPAAGSFRTCLVKNNAAITGGTLNLRWRVNGVSVGAAGCTMSTAAPRQDAGSIDAGVVTFNAGDTISVAFDTVGLLPAATNDFTVYWSVEYNSSSSSLTMQKVYDSSAAPVTVITADNKNISYTLSNTATDSNFLVNIATGSTSKFAVQNNGTDILNVNTSGGVAVTGNLAVSGTTTLSGNLLAAGASTGTTGTTAAPARVGVTAVTLTAAGTFANNDVIFINNAGQDYYTRIVSGAGTVNLVVSPAVSYDAGAAVTKYTVQNIGATATDYTTQANRFFQGYFLGGVVVGAGSTTISDGNIESTTTLTLQKNGGALDIGGALNVTGTITGSGAGLTNIDGSQITGGSIADGSLSANVTIQGNTFNGVSQLVQLDGSGNLPALSGAALTSLNGSNISSGTVADARLSGNVTLLGNTFNGVSQLVQLDGTGKLPVLDGSNLTNVTGSGITGINASNISTGTLADARLTTNVTLLGNTFNGNNQLVQLGGTGALPALSGAALTALNGSNISSGTVADARLSTSVTLLGNTFNGNNQLVQLGGTGALPALNGSALTTLNASNISSGTLADARLSGNVTVAGNTFNGNSQLVQLTAGGLLPVLSGANLTSLSGTNISSGTVADARLSANVTLLGNTFNAANTLLQLDAGGKVADSLLSTNITAQGNTFNGNNQLVKLGGTGALPALSGAALTSLNGSNISSGTVADARLSSNVTLLGNTFNGVSQLVQLTAGGVLPALGAANLTGINGTNISSGTVADARLSTNVTLAGNTFNGNNGLVQLTGTGALPALSGAALTALNGSNISSGTVADARLTTNVTLLGNAFNGVSQLVQLNGSGALPTLSGVNLTTLNGSNISSGTVADARLSGNVTLAGNTFNGANGLVQLTGTGALPALSGAALTTLNGANISSGTVADARLTTNVTLLGNTFNGNNQLVQLGGTGALPALNGSALTTLNATNISSGTVNDLRLSANVTLKGNTFNGVNGLVVLDGSGNLPALNGAALTTLNGTNISSGTVADARLSANVTLKGNTFNGVSQLVLLDASGNLPALNGAALTTLNGTNVSSGTVADARLSSNVSLLGTSQTYTAQKTFAANISLGTDSASPTAGLLTLNDTTGSNGFTSVLGTTALTASRAISLPDEAGTVCLRSSTLCGFALIGAAAAQVDSTTNPSLFINKTGATGNILTLQKGGTTVFSVLNSGALAIQTTATNAINVKNAGGTDFFNVDTSGALVQIGSATADANATLLVLDTKNTAGDPTGVNGGSYYNSASGKSRCYENNNWQDCTTGINENKAADQTVTNSAVFTNDTALVFAMAANASYKIDATINYSTTSAAADFKYTFTIPAGATVYLATDADTAATTRTICNITASGQTCTLANTAGFRGIIKVTGIITTAGTAGNVQFQFAQNAGTAGQSVTVYKGSLLTVSRTDQ